MELLQVVTERELMTQEREARRAALVSGGNSGAVGNQADCVHLGEWPSSTTRVSGVAIAFGPERIAIEGEV